MLESLFGISVGITLSDLGVLTALTTIVVQVLKSILPKSFPTKILTVIIGLVLTIGLIITGFGFSFTNIGIGILAGFVVSFVSMNGFDSLKDIWQRFTMGNIGEQLQKENEVLDEEDEVEGED